MFEFSALAPPASSDWLTGLHSPLIQEDGEEKKLKLRFDVSQYTPEEIVVKTVDQKLMVTILLHFIFFRNLGDFCNSFTYFSIVISTAVWKLASCAFNRSAKFLSLWFANSLMDNYRYTQSTKRKRIRNRCIANTTANFCYLKAPTQKWSVLPYPRYSFN